MKGHSQQITDTYKALSFKGIEQRPNYRSVSYRMDMLHVLDKKDAAAIIYQIIYRWQEHRRDEIQVEIEKRQKGDLAPLTAEEVQERMWIYMSYNDFVRETGGAISYNTVIDALNYLVNKKKVFNRRKNPNPHYSDYEYCINKEEVCKLLKQLPEFPHFVAKGTKGKKQQAAGSTNSGTGTTSEGSTEIGTGSTEIGTGSTEIGTGSTEIGRELYQNWGTSQNSTQSPTQSLTQNSTQKEDAANAATPSLLTLVENLTLEELDLIAQKIQERREQSAPTSQETTPSSSIEEPTQSSTVQGVAATSATNRPAVPSSTDGATVQMQLPGSQVGQELQEGKIVQPVSQSASVKTEKTRQPKPKSAVMPQPAANVDPPAIVLSERAQSVEDEWASMPWFRGVRPKRTETLATHYESLAQYDPLPTADEMLKARRAYKQKYPTRRGFYLGNFVTFYPEYLSDQFDTTDQESRGTNQPTDVPNEGTPVYWNTEGNRKCFNSMIWDWMPYAEAVKHGYTPDQKLSEAEVKNHEDRKALRREVEERKAQRLAPVPA